MFNLVLQKAEEPKIKFPTSTGSWKKEESSKNIYFCFIDYAKVPGAGERHSTHDKGHEEGGSAYAKAGSSLGVPPDILKHLPPKTRVCLLNCFVLSPLTLLGAVPHHHLALSVKELTYSSN